MKKKIFGGIAVLAIAMVAAFNVNFNTQSNDLLVINLANVEALARLELDLKFPDTTHPKDSTKAGSYVYIEYLDKMICAGSGSEC
jgi:hypothetical protein